MTTMNTLPTQSHGQRKKAARVNVYSITKHGHAFTVAKQGGVWVIEHEGVTLAKWETKWAAMRYLTMATSDNLSALIGR